MYEAQHPEKVEEWKEKNKHPYMFNKREQGLTIPGTEYVVSANPHQVENLVGKMGDDKVGAFIGYHLDMMNMRMGVDKNDVQSLYERFGKYLQYCMEKNILPNNMNAYFAIGISRSDVSRWYTGKAGTPAHRQFAEDIKAFFSSIHEQAGLEGMTNPILTIWWQKSHDLMTDSPQQEVMEESALGDRQNAETIAAKWKDVELPD